MQTVQFFTDLLSSSVDGQWPQDQSLTRILLCINPDDRPVLWLVNFSFFLVTCSFRMSIDRDYFFCLLNMQISLLGILLSRFSLCFVLYWQKNPKKNPRKNHVCVMSRFTVSVCTNKGLVSDGDKISSVLCVIVVLFSVYSLL